jgi:hypothetical protein
VTRSPRCLDDPTYTGHWLVFPRAKRCSRLIITFVDWLAKELALHIDSFQLS